MRIWGTPRGPRRGAQGIRAPRGPRARMASPPQPPEARRGRWPGEGRAGRHLLSGPLPGPHGAAAPPAPAATAVLAAPAALRVRDSPCAGAAPPLGGRRKRTERRRPGGAGRRRRRRSSGGPGAGAVALRATPPRLQLGAAARGGTASRVQRRARVTRPFPCQRRGSRPPQPLPGHSH